MLNYSFEFYFAKNSLILFRKKILRLFIGFTMSRFMRNILLIEICYVKFFNFRIKIIFRDKILYQFNKFNVDSIVTTAAPTILRNMIGELCREWINIPSIVVSANSVGTCYGW